MSEENPDSLGHIFRAAWIAGVLAHYYPGKPKASYISPWDEMPEWERDSATAVAEQIRAFLVTTNGQAAKLGRKQKGQFVAACWVGQIFKHFPDPKPAYVAGWDKLPIWQQMTDTEIFEAIERHVLAT
jgi:hypothetical protein